ncbi:MAG TPA: RNA 2',3'-cyclic phosphodiesterase [Streptosporangiaceae bacterium]
MRLFVAITPPVVALEELDAAVAPLRRGSPELRWTKPESWHITLAFLGEVEQAAADRLSAPLSSAAARHAGLGLSTAGGGAFPSSRRAGVLWTGIQGDREALRDVAASVTDGARAAGAPSPDEGRRFRPHITLARLREPGDVSGLIAQLKGYVGATWQADAIHLIRSHAGPQPWYESLGSWPLRVSAHP